MRVAGRETPNGGEEVDPRERGSGHSDAAGREVPYRWAKIDPRILWALAAAATGLSIAACGGSAGDGAPTGPTHAYTVAIRATFPARQRLAEHSELTISVRNTGRRAIPNVAVTLSNPETGTAAQALGRLLPKPKQGAPLLASRSRPIWIIDKPPGPCRYDCDNGGPGGATTAYSNTWALGRVKPGGERSFTWHVTAITAGTYRVRYSVAASLDGNQHTVTATHGTATGQLRIHVSNKPPAVRVTQSGKVHYG